MDIAFTPLGALIAGGTAPTAQTNGAVTAAVTQITLPAVPADGANARFVAQGTQDIAWCWGSNANLTLQNGVYMSANATETFAVPAQQTQVSVIAGATGTTLRIGLGRGSN